MISIYNPIRGEYRITQIFGANPQVYKQFGLAGHNGIDLAFPISGTKGPLYSPVKGKVVVRAEDPRGFGKYIKIETDENELGEVYEITMAHLDSFNIKVGDRVGPNKKIGIMGTTGFSTGVHLHLGVRVKKNGIVQNYYNGYKGAVDFEMKGYTPRIYK
ncbi:MAG TPA: M23 family metallopeptidase [Candidatus Absconditabacterales bacterium]|nr:M23 family metallopeptidase [Candidatus Absconditabacterales bacterium]